MFGHDFYHGTIRKYVIMFGNMFNDIDVVRYNSSGSPIQTIRVPIAYGPREKYLARLNTDIDLDREVSIQLPRLSFEITNISYAPNRGLNKLTPNVGQGSSSGELKSSWTPTPYDITFSLYGMFEHQEDAVQVVEQILPFFRPEWTQTVTLVPEIGDKYDIPTVLNDLSIEDTYEADFQTRRAIIYTFNFVVKGYMFGPTTNRGIIQRAIVDISANNIVESPFNRRTILNAGATVDDEISFEKEDYFDGIDRHEHGS